MKRWPRLAAGVAATLLVLAGAPTPASIAASSGSSPADGASQGDGNSAANSYGQGSGNNAGNGNAQANANGPGSGNAQLSGTAQASGNGLGSGSAQANGNAQANASGASAGIAQGTGNGQANGTGAGNGQGTGNAQASGAGGGSSSQGNGNGNGASANSGRDHTGAVASGATLTEEDATTVAATELTTAGLAIGSASVPTSKGGSVVAGNVSVSLPPAALAGSGGASAVVVNVAPAAGNLPVPGGPAQYSPNGTLADVSVSANGRQVTTFPAPITLTLKYNAADVAMAGGDARKLTVAFVIDAASPAIENPLHFPVGTFAIAPGASVDQANGVIRVQTQALGSVVAVVTNPVGFVQTLRPSTRLYSSFDPAASQVFGSAGQFHYLEVVEPQVGDRLLTLDPDTGAYAYVDASTVGPSGPPPATPAGVIRGLLRF